VTGLSIVPPVIVLGAICLTYVANSRSSITVYRAKPIDMLDETPLATITGGSTSWSIACAIHRIIR
jgi:hypothetical protein